MLVAHAFKSLQEPIIIRRGSIGSIQGDSIDVGEDEDEEVPEDLKDLPWETQQTRLKMRSAVSRPRPLTREKLSASWCIVVLKKGPGSVGVCWRQGHAGLKSSLLRLALERMTTGTLVEANIQT